jgi:predicted small metal-binding protein
MANGVPGLPSAGFLAPARHILRCRHRRRSIRHRNDAKPSGAAGEAARRGARLPEDMTMARKYIDCRLFPSDSKCSVAISADSVDEVVDAAVQHAVAVHHHEDSPQLRQQIRSCIKEGSPAT